MKKLILLLVVCCAISCTKKEEPIVVAPYVPQTIAFVELGKGDAFRGVNNTITSNNTQINLTINNLTDWYNFKESFARPSYINYALSETTIDFNLYQVIAVFDKGQVSSPNKIDITSVVINENNITISIQKHGAGDLQTPSRSYHIIKIPASSKPIVFQVNEPI